MRYTVRSRERVNDWENGYFSGNGTVGAIVIPDFEHGKIIFNHESLFIHTNELECFPDMSDVFASAIDAEADIDARFEYAKRFFDIAAFRGLRNKIFPEDGTLYPDRYFPAFEMSVNCGCGSFTDFERSLDTSSAEISASAQAECGAIRQRVFTAYDSGIVYISLEAERECDFSFKISTPEPKSDSDRLLIERCILKETYRHTDRGLYARVDMNRGYYTALVAPICDGEITYENNTLKIRNGRSVTLAVAIALDSEPAMSVFNGYDDAFSANLPLYRELFFSSEIEISDNPYMGAYSEELFDCTNDGKLAALMQKMYYVGRYLTISSFGKLPPNAQGLWSGNVDGRTMCDYVSNMELEMALWAPLAANLPQLLLPTFDFLDSLVPEFEENAKKLFGARGIAVTSRFTNSGLMFHFSGGYCHQFWISGGAWLAQSYFEYYLYTKDTDFLRSRALPFMRKAADFYLDYVKNGVIFPSVSPENSPFENRFSMLGKNAAMDISAIKELFSNIRYACEILGIENEYKISVPDYLYRQDGTLCEWSDEKAVPAYSHRHISFAYAAMPGTEAQSDLRLASGIDKLIDKRIENGFYTENEGTCGWSVMHLINVYARLRKSGKIRAAIEFLFAHYVRRNLTTCLNYSTTIFQIDANLGFVNAMYEMLVYSDEKTIRLLPCLPEPLKSGRARDLILKYGRTVKSLEWDEGGVYAELVSNTDTTLTVCLGDDERKISFKKDEPIKVKFSKLAD